MSPRILALSSSRVGNEGYLQTTCSIIQDFLPHSAMQMAFVPFASVGSYEEYLSSVQQALKELPHTITLADHHNANIVLEQSDVIMVGGGNTFKLLHGIYEAGILDTIRSKVSAGTPYIGWSAGSNVTGPTISTTNDMPIIQPESFNAFNFFPFQINPHYSNYKPEGFNGETRDQRLAEFLKLNPGRSVVCLPEGTALDLRNNILTFTGICNGVLMKEDFRQEISPGADLSFLM